MYQAPERRASPAVGPASAASAGAAEGGESQSTDHLKRRQVNESCEKDPYITDG